MGLVASERTVTRDPGGTGGGQLVEQPMLFRLLCGEQITALPWRCPLGAVTEVRLGRGSAPAGVDGSVLQARCDDARMSSEHARITKALGRWRLEDLGSKNGTFVHGTRVQRHDLCDGDIIELGDTFFLYRARVAVPVAPPAVASWSEVQAAAPALTTLDPAFERQVVSMQRVAGSLSPVLLLGDSGAGKEVVARSLHDLSQRSGPFIAVNCAALPDNLVESELFGVRKGAYSGAETDRAGLVAAADHGTLFLDEIGDLPLAAQATLLRVLEDRSVRPVGDTIAAEVDFRLVAATNRPLERRVSAGSFRDDLYHRLAGFVFTLPDLRGRLCDLGALIAHLLTRLDPERGPSIRFHFRAVRAMLAAPWAGNVRELLHCLETASAICDDGLVRLEDLPERVRRVGADEVTQSPDRQRLVDLLTEHGGNVAAVASALGTSRSQVHRLAKRFGLDFQSFRLDRA